MSTIKIDRGFTQKIQHKDMTHTPADQTPPPPSKRPKGGQKRMAYAVAGGVALVTVIVSGIFIFKGPKKAEVAAQTLQLTPTALKTAQPAADKNADLDKPVEPTAAADLNTKTPAIPSPQQADPVQYTPKLISREVPVGSPQGLLCEYYEHVKGGFVSDLRAAGTFPGQPSRTVQVRRFELSEGLGENYGVRVRGYLVPPKSGIYTFVVNVDDTAELWLSTDDQPANIRRLVALTTHTKKKWSERPEQQSDPCELVGGKRYYLEALMKQGTSGDYLAVGWKGLETDKLLIIEAPFLQPWTDAPTADQAVASVANAPATDKSGRSKAKEEREALLAPAKAAVAEQQRLNGAAYRYAEAAQVLKDSKSSWRDPAALAVVETAILRFELLGRLRAFVQAELARAAVKGVWVAFGGQSDVTSASDEGVTVAPGRIVAWAKVPPDQMLRLVNTVLPKAAVDTTTKSTLFLASAVYCKEVSGGIDMALKYRERAVSINSTLAPLADRVLGGSPESILAQPRIQASSAELGRVAATAAGLADKVFKRQSDFSSITGLVAGLNVEYWENVTSKSLDEVRKQGLTTKTAPDSTQRIADFVTPENRGEQYFARLTGFLVPAVSGEYFFYIAADDHGELWLSPDESSDKAVVCVKNEAPGGRRQWDKDKRKSKPVTLVKGRHYFVKALLREGSGGDHLAVAWSLAAEDNPVLITSEYLLCSLSAGVSSNARELRKKIEDDLRSVQSLAAEIIQLGDAEEIRADTQVSATTQIANEVQKQAERAKVALGDAESTLKRIDSSLPQLKAALRPEGGKPQ